MASRRSVVVDWHVSLSVHVYLPRPGGEWDLLDDPPGGAELAGFESWRTTVWGSPDARALGARFLPRLATDDLLMVPPADLPAFRAECELIRARFPHLTATVSARLRNIENAVERAGACGGGVLVW